MGPQLMNRDPFAVSVRVDFTIVRNNAINLPLILFDVVRYGLFSRARKQ